MYTSGLQLIKYSISQSIVCSSSNVKNDFPSVLRNVNFTDRTSLSQKKPHQGGSGNTSDCLNHI